MTQNILAELQFYEPDLPSTSSQNTSRFSGKHNLVFLTGPVVIKCFVHHAPADGVVLIETLK